MRRGARGELGAGRGDHLAAIGVHQVLGERDAAEGLGVERTRPALRRAGEHHLLVEEVQDLLGVHAADLGRVERLALRLARLAQVLGMLRGQRIEQRRHRQLALPVDAHIDEVLAVELEIEPGAAIGDHARGEEILAARMRLALVVVEEHARRAVHLADDDALGAIDDEGAVIRHERHVAHVDRLLLDVPDRAGARIFIDIPDDEAQHDLQRRGIGHASLDALLDVVFRLFQLVIDELEPAAAGEIVDREDRLEHFLQPGLRAAVRGDVHLQERLVARPLHVDQVRHRRHLGDAPEAPPDPLLPRERLASNRVHRPSFVQIVFFVSVVQSAAAPATGNGRESMPIPALPISARREDPAVCGIT
jgi:hypothetical protein